MKLCKQLDLLNLSYEAYLRGCRYITLMSRMFSLSLLPSLNDAVNAWGAMIQTPDLASYLPRSGLQSLLWWQEGKARPWGQYLLPPPPWPFPTPTATSTGWAPSSLPVPFPHRSPSVTKCLGVMARRISDGEGQGHSCPLPGWFHAMRPHSSYSLGPTSSSWGLAKEWDPLLCTMRTGPLPPRVDWGLACESKRPCDPATTAMSALWHHRSHLWDTAAISFPCIKAHCFCCCWVHLGKGTERRSQGTKENPALSPPVRADRGQLCVSGLGFMCLPRSCLVGTWRGRWGQLALFSESWETRNTTPRGLLTAGARGHEDTRQ